ncbi:MAG: outer membrane beta-barrel protein [Ignavibacteriales bacterium]|nr:outer membrane beta-barrel protein [Ignavibacteriales bacterium]
MKNAVILSLIASLACSLGFAQQARLSAAVVDFVSRAPLVSANVSLMNAADTATKRYTSTNAEGKFYFANLTAGSYQLRVWYVGYRDLTRKVTIAGTGVEMGMLTLTQTSILMGEYVVKGEAPPVVQVGDTVQFNSKAFKLNLDATAEDLLTKLPGVTVENNTVTAQGENVGQVFVDGKRFFGDDPMLAIRNLPAEIIDKIQVYDKMSDQSELTGFNDGQTTKTINIITRPDRRRGQFGRLVAAYGDEGKYQAAANTNVFQGTRRITLLGQSNNINQQNFTAQDFLGAMGGGPGGGFGGGGGGGMMGGGGRGGAGAGGQRPGGSGGAGGGRAGGGGGGGQVGQMNNNFSIGQQNGINTTHALGGQYTDTWGAGLNVEGNYFFNLTDNKNDQLTDRQYFLTADTSQYYRQTNLSDARNNNHRLNMRIEYTIDASNEVIINPRLNVQSNNSVSNFDGLNWLQGAAPLSKSASLNTSDVNGYTSSNSIVYRHKFDTRGRSISLQATANLNTRKSERYLKSDNVYFTGATRTADSLNQFADTRTNGQTFGSNITYTEPVGTSGLAQLNYSISRADNSTDKKSYNYDYRSNFYSSFDPTVSNQVQSGYLTHHADIGFQYRDSAFSATLGVGYQSASLTGDRTFPKSVTTDKAYRNILPNATVYFGITRTNNVQILYRTATSAPSISQLENTIDNSNPLLLTAGNSDLKQYYTHTLTARYITTNLQTMQSFFLLLSGSSTEDYIGNSLLLAQKDTTIEGGVVLKQGSQLSKPVNLGSQQNLRALVTYSIPISWIQCNVHLNSGVNYNETPSLINSATNTATTYTLSEGVGLSSNISTDLDFTLGYSANFNNVTNTIQASMDIRYFSHTANLRFNWTFWEGFTFRTDVRNQIYTRSETGFNQSYTLWNITIGKKFLQDNRGEISAQVFDVLSQNKNVRQTVTDTYIQEQQTKNLNRYFLLTFTYRLSNF